MKKAFCLVISFVLIFSVLSGCSLYEQEQKNTDINALENIVLNKDLVEISKFNNIVKIDSIASGLDAYSFDTVLFDLAKGKTLCEVSFSEGMWISGLTENGFYAIDSMKKELKIYDKSGNIAKAKDFSDTDEPMYFCALSEDEKLFVYSNSQGTKLTAIDLSDNSKRYIDLEAPLRDVLSFKKDILRAVSIDGEVYEIDVNALSCNLLIADNRIKLFSSNYCLGETETNFLLANDKACYYVPISSANEVPFGFGTNGFATVSFSNNEYLLRFYDLKEHTVSYYSTDKPVELVCYLDNGNVLAVVGSSMDKEHKIIELKPKGSEKLTVLDEDTVVNQKENHTDASADLSSYEKLIQNVPLISQFPAYPTGCESVSAVMALNYSGNPISVEEFIDDFLPTSRDFRMENGKLLGPSPYEYFVGNPKSASSYGCMATVIQKALLECTLEPDRVINITDSTLLEICEKYIDNDIPVIMWVTINMLETNPINSWYLDDDTRYTWPGNEHCMLLVGYDENSYYFNDPYTGKLVAYDKTLTQNRFAELGRQALVILPR